ncbi:unnamed protein product [Rhizophagus irregularis]|nr:unnamed protein product [Rhizophagus irregularis]
MIILLVTSSTPIRRQDALSGFKSCKDNFPNCEATIHIAGKATVIIENVSSPNDPKNTVKEYLIRIQITNLDVSCIEGNIKISYP